MTQTKKKYLKISKGQIAPELVERTDIGLLDDSGQTITNFYNTKYGALKSVPGTKSVVKWDGDVKARMLKIVLPNNNEAFILFNGTNHTMQLFSHIGVPLSTEVSCEHITTNNISKLSIAQQQDLCLLCTTTTPLIKITVSATGLSWAIFEIPPENILQYQDDSTVSLIPNLFRATELSDDIISFPVIINSSETPPTGSATIVNLAKEKDEKIFHIESVKIKSFPASKWEITSYSVSNMGTNYAVGDLIVANNLSFTITAYGEVMGVPVAEISLVNPQESYDTNKAGNFPAIGGSGSGMIITIATNELQYRTGDILTIKGTQWEINNLAVDEELVAIDPEATFLENPTEENVAAEGGSYHDMLVDVEGDYQHRVYSETTYNFQNGDVLQDLFGNNAVYSYMNNQWITPTGSEDVIKTCKYRVDPIYTGAKATLSFRKAVEKWCIPSQMFPWGIYISDEQDSLWFTVQATSADNAIKVFKSGIIGSKVSATDSNMGVMRVSSVSVGSARSAGNGKYNVQLYSVTGILEVGFVSGSSGITMYEKGHYRTLKFEFSYKKGFAGGLPGTSSNPTNSLDFPQSILFYQQRLLIGGTAYNRQQILASKLAEYNNFANDENNVKDAFQLIISSNKKEIIQHLFLNQGVQIFCKDSEWIINSQQVSSSSGFLKNSDIGSNEVYPSLSANGITLFVPQNGKGIISFSYNYEQANYSTPYISLFTNLLNTEIKDLYLKKGQSSEEDTLLLICNVDGDLIIGNYLVDHEIQAFCRRHEEHTKFLQCIECEDNVFMLTQRNNNTTLEILDKTASTSLETTTGFSISSGKITLTDTRYCNQLINTYDSNGDFIEQIEIDNNGEGAVTKETPVAKVGINIHSTFESNPLNYSIETYNEYKNIRQFKIVLPKNPKGKFVTVNKKFPRRKDNFWEYYRVARPQRDCRFKVENDIYPCEILSFEIDLEV